MPDPPPAIPVTANGPRELYESVSVRDVNHWFGTGDGRKQILFDNRLTLMRGELIIMTGPSGSGKTTLLTLIGGLRSIQNGSVQFYGQELSQRTPLELTQIRRSVGFIFQNHNLLESLTACQNVRMAAQLTNCSREDGRQRSIEILTRLGLQDRLHYRPDQLSGGQRQRVAIARALVNHPSLILADEPTAALDGQAGRNVLSLLKEFTMRDRCTVLIVTHDPRLIEEADRIVNMIDGHVVSAPPVDETVEICEFLARCPIFQQNTRESLSAVSGRWVAIELPNSPELLAAIANQMHRCEFPAGATVIRSGESGDSFYIVRQGLVEVIDEESAAGHVLARLGPGQYFGERALIYDEPRNATVRCLEDTSLYRLGRDSFYEVLNSAATLNHQIRSALFLRSR